MIAVSVIVVTHNDAKWFSRLFNSFCSQGLLDQIEFIFVDNNSTDGSDSLAWHFGCKLPHFKCAQTYGDFGYGYACNIGASLACGDYVFFINADVWLEDNCIATLYGLASCHKHKAISCTECNYDNNNLVHDHHAQGCVGFDWFGIASSKPDWRHSKLFTVGSFLFIERGLFYSIGLFNKDFYLYGEEQFMSWKCLIAGEPVSLCNSARIHHAVGRSKIGGISAEKRKLANRNHLLTLLICGQHILLLCALSFTVLMVVESLVYSIVKLSPSFFRISVIDVLIDCWKLRSKIASERKMMSDIRVLSDWYILLHYFCPFSFAHWSQIKELCVRK